MLFAAKVKGGKLILTKRGSFDAYVAQFEGRMFMVDAFPFDHQSNNQRKFFHVVCRFIASHCEGYTMDDVKLAVKGLGLPAIFDETGEPRIGQTRRLTREQYSELIDFAIRWAAETLQLCVPDPRPVAEFDMEDLRSVGAKR